MFDHVRCYVRSKYFQLFSWARVTVARADLRLSFQAKKHS
jgi:hypothetical protein